MAAQIKEILSLEYILTAGDTGEFSILYNGTIVAKKGELEFDGGFPTLESVIERMKRMKDTNI